MEDTGLAFRQVAFGSQDFDAILELRSGAYERDEAGKSDSIDVYSLHFGAFDGKRIVGALRVTCANAGELESQEHYPSWLMEEFGGLMCAASRMCVTPELQSRSTIPLALTELAWKTVIPMGIRLDVSKARVKAIPFYLKMGYVFIRDSFFSFGKWDAVCGLMAYPANPRHAGLVSHLFNGLGDPVSLDSPSRSQIFVDNHKEFIGLARPFREGSVTA